MDYSAANHALWNVIIQMGYIAAVILIAISLRQTVKPIRKTMLPVAVLGGFILLLAKETGIIDLDENLLSALTYHPLSLPFQPCWPFCSARAHQAQGFFCTCSLFT